MPMWRCPHCGTPQAETARCWVCHRSSTTCGTCRHFRRSVAAQLGYCGLDRQRQPLNGDEIRGCWEAWPGDEARDAEVVALGPAHPADRPHRLDFVEVGAIADETMSAEEDPAIVVGLPTPDTGWSLWGDPDR
jgi:hypothetical protein